MLSDALVRNRFSDFYQNTYFRKTCEDKAFKDIVGEEYEKYRKDLWSLAGFKAESGKVADYNVDLIVYDSAGNVKVIEEDKGHYVDLCFLKRFFSNAAEIINHFIAESKEVPYIVLSSPTTYRLYEENKEKIISLYRYDIQQVLRDKVKYLSICEHDRVRKTNYYQNKNSCFVLSESKIQNNINFMNNIGEQNEK